jgi:hypothetical protein
MSESLAALVNRVEAELRPATALERWFANEIAYASWELARVRHHANHVAAEATLTAVYNRASRNWNRARKEFKRIQTARANQLVRLHDQHRPTAAAFPLADPARIPLPDPALFITQNKVANIMNDIDSELAELRSALKQKGE